MYHTGGSWLVLWLLTSLLAGAEAAPSTAFPLRVSADQRHLADRDGRPFLVVGDTAWSLVAQLGEEDIARYLDDRASRGFNAIIVNLIEHKYATRAPATRDGTPPFLKPGDFTEPNPAYFDFARRAIDQARRRGISVWLCPAYLGWGGGDEGFFKEIKAAGPAALRGYGHFVGGQFKELPNIVWMMGGDYALPANERWAGNELALGLREGGATQLMTAHGGQLSALDTFGDQPWLAVDTVYSYATNLYVPLLANAARRPARPFVLIEAIYEGEHEARPEQIRRQAYWAMLCGAGGQFFGNNPLWHFDGPTLFPHPGSWQEALGGTGSRDMARLAALFARLPWHQLAPDRDHPLVTSGEGSGRAMITAARTPDGRLSLLYIPSDGKEPREFSVNLGELSIPIAAHWFNPARDGAMIAAGTNLAGRGALTFRTPGDNGTGANDWVLLLEGK